MAECMTSAAVGNFPRSDATCRAQHSPSASAHSLSSSPTSAAECCTSTTSTPFPREAHPTGRRFGSARTTIRRSSRWLVACFAGGAALTALVLIATQALARRASGDSTLDWKRSVIDRDAGCVVHHECEGELQAHHVVTQQHLRKRHLDCAWDRRIGVTVCERAHRRHHSARERIPYDSLPMEVVGFVNDLGLDWYLVKYYRDAPPLPASELVEDLNPGRARLRGLERKGSRAS